MLNLVPTYKKFHIIIITSEKGIAKLQTGYMYHKLREAFSKFYRRHFDIVSKYNVGLKTLLLQGLSEPEFYGDLVYKFRKKELVKMISLIISKR